MPEPQAEPEPEAEVGGSAAAATIEAQQRTIAALEAQLRGAGLLPCTALSHLQPAAAAPAGAAAAAAAADEADAAETAGIPTPPSPLFLGRFAPVFRRFSAVPLRCPAFWRRDGENGRKMAETGRNLGEKRARNSGG